MENTYKHSQMESNMTEIDAIKILEEEMSHHERGDLIKAFQMAIRALNNNGVAQHPIYREYWGNECPKCGSLVMDYNNYCSECGQKIEFE